uniref:Uncharacterized protein n=1 Tax=Siphoviridae sp. ctTXt1 TaxID=2825520 RepID=A0A8S5PAM7_9CAUD|nr:MAG TPA: hypothetical protein [Siphoviridae sp. ctTXt1]
MILSVYLIVKRANPSLQCAHRCYFRNQLPGYTMVRDSCFYNDIGRRLKYDFFYI